MNKRSPVVMVVEDENLLLQAITKKLKINGIETVSCTSGEQAVDYLKNLAETSELPDAIWLDYHLSGLDGLEVLLRIKQDEKTKNIPVIVVSNSADDERVKNVLSLGAKKYLLKAEHKLEDIIQVVRDLVKKGEVSD